MKAIKNLLGGLLLVIILIILDREIGEERQVKKHSNFWLFTCLLGLMVLGLANKCVNAQQVPIFYGALRQGVLGQTVCNKKDEVAIIINDGYNFDSVGLSRVVAHELVHVSQMKALGGCQKASLVYMKDPMAQEIPAYCAELKARMVTDSTALDSFIRHIHGMYGIPKKMSVEQVARRVEELCTGRKDDSS